MDSLFKKICKRNANHGKFYQELSKDGKEILWWNKLFARSWNSSHNEVKIYYIGQVSDSTGLKAT